MTHRVQSWTALGGMLATLLFHAAVLRAQTVDAFLDNGTVRIGVTRAYGGAITWLSTNGGDNLVNNTDRGRQIQQSYYAGANLTAANQCPAWSPWPWNPIMVGDCEGNSSPVLVLTNVDGRLYMKAQPLLWDRRNVLSQSFIELWISFHPTLPNVVVVDNLFTCFRDAGDEWGGPVNRHQEVPACYFVSCLNAIKSYTGAAPWQNAALATIPNVFIWTNFVPTEQWAACVNASDFGVGIYTPDATSMNAGKFGAGVTCNTFDSSTMHIAPLVTKAFDRNSVYGYRCFLAVGQLPAIRSAFYQIRANPALVPAQTLIPTGTVWRFSDRTNDPGPGWHLPGYDDSNWSRGPSQLGFGDGDETTLIASNRQITTYFRHEFAASAGTITNLQLRLLRDDGAVGYLNGVEIFRSNMPTGVINRLTPAVAAIGGADEANFLAFAPDPALLRDGRNLLAVEVHQNSATSSDVSFNLDLRAYTRPVQVTIVQPGAEWRYLDNGTAPAAAWLSNAFNPATWKSGVTKLGFGGDGEVTTIARTNASGGTNITFYFRRQFYVPDPADVFSLQATLIRDDGAVVYLNGAEVWRDSMPAGVANYLTLANATISGAGETNWLTNSVSPSALIAGWNTLAVEVHQSTINSSDVGFNFELTASVLLAELPSLSLSLQPSALNVSWPADASWFTPQFTTNLTPPVAWLPLTNVPVLTGNQWRVTLPLPTNGQRYFRMQTP